MEINSSYQRSTLISELIQGMELTKQLRANIGPEFTSDSKEALVQQILSSYDKALAILGICSSSTIFIEQEQQQQQQNHLQFPSPAAAPTSPISFAGSSPKSDDFNPVFHTQHNQDASKKRKMACVRTEQVQVNPDTGLEGPPSDGFNWRKYGQKDILGAKYPRSYYRCTYRNVQDCWATRQVQRSDDDPSIFNIIYKGNHTCTIPRRSKSAPTSPPPDHHFHPQQNAARPPVLESQCDPTSIPSFQTGLPLPTPNIDITVFPFSAAAALQGLNFTPTDNNNNHHHHHHHNSSSSDFYSSHSPSLISPSTPGSNYFSASPCEMDAFGGMQYRQQHDLDRDIISAATSATNSPTTEPNLSFGRWNFNPGFQYSDPSFFA